MKRFVVLAVVLGLLVGGVASAAGTSITGTSSVSWGHPLWVPFTTDQAGPVSVRVQWQPKSGTTYFLDVSHLTNRNDVYSYDQWCAMYTDWPNIPAPGDWTCTIPDGKPGYWLLRFYPKGGGKMVPVVYTITAEMRVP